LALYFCKPRETIKNNANQYKHEKQGKNNIFIEFYQMVNKCTRFLPQQGGGGGAGLEIFLAANATLWYGLRV